ncbi:undecaprenyl diphosphate synthase family protein [Candidatus Woesearchaeota archaeon]|nr:undecaprenyl diphosphate synthase family protein [Candidatus Woesearchaeota archaeon]
MNIIELFRKREKTGPMDPKHLGLILSTNPEKQNVKEMFQKLNDTIQLIKDDNIPIFSVYFPDDPDNDFIVEFELFINGLCDNTFINENQVRVSFIGKWYELPGTCIDTIKKCLDVTKNYDRNFLNICIYYDGQQEIIDAFRVILKKMKGDNPDNITKETIKHNTYTSYFLPPDMIIITGKKRSLRAFLLWDSADASIYHSNKYFENMSKSSVHDYVAEYRH